MLIIRAYMRLPMAAFSSLSGFTRNNAPMTLPKRLTTGSPIKTPAWFLVLGEYTLSPFSTFCRYCVLINSAVFTCGICEQIAACVVCVHRSVPYLKAAAYGALIGFLCDQALKIFRRDIRQIFSTRPKLLRLYSAEYPAARIVKRRRGQHSAEQYREQYYYHYAPEYGILEHYQQTSNLYPTP